MTLTDSELSDVREAVYCKVLTERRAVRECHRLGMYVLGLEHESKLKRYARLLKLLQKRGVSPTLPDV